MEIDSTVYALDSTTIDQCRSLFPWARFRKTKAAVKLHTLLDLRGSIPEFIHITDGKFHNVNVLDLLIPAPGAFYVMDRGSIDFERLYRIHEAGAFFVTRGKRNLQCRRRYSHAVDKTTGLRSDHTVVLTVSASEKVYPVPFRRVRYLDPETKQRFAFVTNNMTLPALTIAQLFPFDPIVCCSVPRTRVQSCSQYPLKSKPGSPPPLSLLAQPVIVAAMTTAANNARIRLVRAGAPPVLALLLSTPRLLSHRGAVLRNWPSCSGRPRGLFPGPAPP